VEERVGELWHRLIVRAAQERHPEAAVRLAEMDTTLGVLFRALGGDGGLRVEAAEAMAHGARRGLLQRIAGTGTRVELAWRDRQALHLPGVIDWFAQRELNRGLYLWLAALAAGATGPRGGWLQRNQRWVRATLARWPGLGRRYGELVQAHLAGRPNPARLRPDEATQERAVRAALEAPGSVERLPPARTAPWPVPLWLHPSPPGLAPEGTDSEGRESDATGGARELEQRHSRRGERSAMPDGNRGLITIRMENILTWGGFSRVDRATDEEEDLDKAAQAAAEMERFNVARDGKTVASRLRFDLDLPSGACDDRVLSGGVLLPEWDWKAGVMCPDHCRILPMEAADAPPAELPAHLRRTARRLRAQFQQLMPARRWLRGRADGSEIDLEAYLRFAAERAGGRQVAAEGLYRDLRSGARDLACLLLADLSLSTDTWIDNHTRVIDVIRDSLHLFAESLAATGDRFGLYGFSSRKRDPVRFHRIKGFDQGYSAVVRGRIQAIKPGYYTRMGAAIRHSRQLLDGQPAERRLLLLISDGKPNDLDRYEGRYGVEDTRRAVQEVRQAGIQPFCVTVDERGNDYLPYLFGSGGYLVIRRPQELPRKLPMLYARLTQ
jgi:nitric oxide reductase NorD protein